MHLNLKVDGLDAVRAQLGAMASQANYAASRALNDTAFAIHAELKTTMRNTFAGGATAFTLRAFKVTQAHKTNLVASVSLRTDAPPGGTRYDAALMPMFAGGLRKYKRLEGWLRGRGILPAGYSVAPGGGMPLDGFGNMRRAALAEMLGVLGSQNASMRIYRRTARNKAQKAVAYFVVLPGNPRNKHPGIYKRLEAGSSSTVKAMVLFVRPVSYRQFIDLPALGRKVAQATFSQSFEVELAKALQGAKK